MLAVLALFRRLAGTYPLALAACGGCGIISLFLRRCCRWFLLVLDGLDGVGVIVLVALTALGLLAFLVASDCVKEGVEGGFGVGRSVVEGRDAFRTGKEDNKRNRTRRECVAECVCGTEGGRGDG